MVVIVEDISFLEYECSKKECIICEEPWCDFFIKGIDVKECTVFNGREFYEDCKKVEERISSFLEFFVSLCSDGIVIDPDVLTSIIRNDYMCVCYTKTRCPCSLYNMVLKGELDTCACGLVSRKKQKA